MSRSTGKKEAPEIDGFRGLPGVLLTRTVWWLVRYLLLDETKTHWMGQITNAQFRGLFTPTR